MYFFKKFAKMMSIEFLDWASLRVA